MRAFDEKDFDLYAVNTRTGVKDYFYVSFILKGVTALLTLPVIRMPNDELRISNNVPVIAFMREHIITKKDEFVTTFLRVINACTELLASYNEDEKCSSNF